MSSKKQNIFKRAWHSINKGLIILVKLPPFLVALPFYLLSYVIGGIFLAIKEGFKEGSDR